MELTLRTSVLHERCFFPNDKVYSFIIKMYLVCVCSDFIFFYRSFLSALLISHFRFILFLVFRSRLSYPLLSSLLSVCPSRFIVFLCASLTLPSFLRSRSLSGFVCRFVCLSVRLSLFRILALEFPRLLFSFYVPSPLSSSFWNSTCASSHRFQSIYFLICLL